MIDQGRKAKQLMPTTIHMSLFLFFLHELDGKLLCTDLKTNVKPTHFGSTYAIIVEKLRFKNDKKFVINNFHQSQNEKSRIQPEFENGHGILN